MALEKKVISQGQNKSSNLTGQLRFEEGLGRIVLFDGTNTRLLIGLDPYSGEVVIVISKEGEDVFEALAP